MSDDKHEHDVPEPHKTKTREELGSRDDARRWLDEGGHIEAANEALYRHMRESQRRLMCLLPITLSVAIMAMREREGVDVSEDVNMALDASAAIAVKYLNPVTQVEQVERMVKDAQDVIKVMDPTSLRNATLGAAYLILDLVDREKVADPTAQSVLASLAITEEAQNDKHAGLRGTWDYDEGRCGQMVSRAVEMLGFRGYL